MNAKLGDTTRWKTALDVLKEVVDGAAGRSECRLARLRPSVRVEVRPDVQGHRARRAAREARSRAHREDRARACKPRGETPLIHSILQTIGDLRAAGGGSVILITDGEESCKGDREGRGCRAQGVRAERHAQHRRLHADRGNRRGRADVRSPDRPAAATTARRMGTQLSRAVKLAALQSPAVRHSRCSGQGARLRADERTQSRTAARQVPHPHRRAGAGARGAVDHRSGPDHVPGTGSRGRPVRHPALTNYWAGG